jgi:hypothetical protein
MYNQYIVMNDEIYDHSHIVLSLFFSIIIIFFKENVVTSPSGEVGGMHIYEFLFSIYFGTFLIPAL